MLYYYLNLEDATSVQKSCFQPLKAKSVAGRNDFGSVKVAVF